MAIRGILLCFYLFIVTPAPAQSVADNNEKAIRTYEVADKALTKIYHKVLKATAYNSELRNELKVTQAAFLLYRDKEGNFYRIKFKDASMQPLFKYRALKRITEGRIKQLAFYFDNL